MDMTLLELIRFYWLGTKEIDDYLKEE